MDEMQLSVLLLFGGLGGGLLMKIVWDWLKGSRNGRQPKIEVHCPYNGTYAKAQLAKLDELLTEQVKTNSLMGQMCDGTKDHFVEARSMTDRILTAIRENV